MQFNPLNNKSVVDKPGGLGGPAETISSSSSLFSSPKTPESPGSVGIDSSAHGFLADSQYDNSDLEDGVDGLDVQGNLKNIITVL